jgi:hypothetical protein
MNVWVPVPDEPVVSSALLEAGFAVASGSRFRIHSAPAIRITTATLDVAEAPRLAGALADALAPAARSSTA